jgi:type VI protein secretion system component VasK
MTEVTSNTHLTHASYVAVAQPERPLKDTRQSAAARGAWEDIGAVFGIALLLAIIALVLLAAPAALDWIAH